MQSHQILYRELDVAKIVDVDWLQKSFQQSRSDSMDKLNLKI